MRAKVHEMKTCLRLNQETNEVILHKISSCDITRAVSNDKSDIELVVDLTFSDQGTPSGLPHMSWN